MGWWSGIGVDCLPSKYEALRSNPRLQKKKKKKSHDSSTELKLIEFAACIHTFICLHIFLAAKPCSVQISYHLYEVGLSCLRTVFFPFWNKMLAFCLGALFPFQFGIIGLRVYFQWDFVVCLPYSVLFYFFQVTQGSSHLGLAFMLIDQFGNAG
jgi:hypothetical protein